MKKYAVGIDIGGTNTVIGFVDKQGVIQFETSFKTKEYPTAELLIGELASYIKEITKKQEIELLGIGIGAPNGNYKTGSIDYAPNLSWEGVVDVVALFKNQINTKVILTNDANAAAIGEKVFGDAKDCNDFIVVTLGTGVGSGFYINGKLLYGHTGYAGELGHIIAIPDGRLCGCGRKGCLETYTSARAIVKTYIELAHKTTDKSLLDEMSEDKIHAELIYKQAVKGEKIALEAFDYTAMILGEKLADAVAITSPERIYLFGGLARAGSFLLKPLNEYFEKSMLSIYRNTVEIRISGLLDKNAAVLGAASLIWENTTK